MRLLADESVDRQVVDRLRDEGFDVDYIAELTPAATDDDILEMAHSNGASAASA